MTRSITQGGTSRNWTREADDYDERLVSLRAELSRRRSLPVVPDRVEEVGTGRMASVEWPRWTRAQRRRFLMDNEFTVILRGREFPPEWRIEVVPGDAYRRRVTRGMSDHPLPIKAV